MEAVPRMPMVQFILKQTAQKSSFSKLKQYIAEIYQEDADSYSNEIHALETLRSAAFNPSIDVAGCNLIKRYYCQLHSIQNRFPIANDHTLVNFSWPDIYTHSIVQSTNIRHDMAVALYNYGALHSQLGASADRSTEDEMKLACTHFQCAAWAFGHVQVNYPLATNGDLAPELLIFMEQICFAQAQECILEKSLMDNRKAVIVAKVTAQIIEYYNTAVAALLTGGDDGTIGDIVGSKLFKEWKQYVQFKIQYLSCILLLYQGQHAEEQQKMGERVILYQKASERLEEARKEAKGMDHIQDINEAISFVADVVEAKRKSAKNENEFIYHEEVPELNTIANIQGANLVKGIAFNVADAEFAAEDIFHRLVPIKTHEASSLYSEEKANILRHLNHKIEKKDKELNKFMDSLSIDFLNVDAPATTNMKVPQPLIDRCADLNAKPNAIPDLISKMSALAEICVDVENSLANIKDLLLQEEQYEKEYQQTLGYRPNGHFVELNREFLKYQEAHNKAGESNDTLRKAMELHVNNLKILSQPLSNLQAAIPACNADLNAAHMQDTRHLVNKVNEMRLQRSQLMSQLNENIQRDDITSQLVAWGDEDLDKLFKTELAKHDQLVSIIEQNIVAQGNILKAFTDTYAKSAHIIKAIADTKHRRESFFSSLIASYDVYDDLLSKSLKGLEFYKKLQSNIHKLQSRVRAARDVHDEERQQRLESINKKSLAAATAHSPITAPTSNRASSMSKPGIDALPKFESDMSNDHFHNAAIRPTPIGQENTAESSQCVTSASGYLNRPVADVESSVKNGSHTGHYPYTPYQQPNSLITSLPHSYGNTVGNYSSNQSFASMPSYTDNENTPTYIPHSQMQASDSSMNSAINTSGYLNPMYSGLQNPYTIALRSVTPSQLPNYPTTSQSNALPATSIAQPQHQQSTGHHSQPQMQQRTMADPQTQFNQSSTINVSQHLSYGQQHSQQMMPNQIAHSSQPDQHFYPQGAQAASQHSYPYNSMASYPVASSTYHPNVPVTSLAQTADANAFHQTTIRKSQESPASDIYSAMHYAAAVGASNVNNTNVANQLQYSQQQPIHAYGSLAVDGPASMQPLSVNQAPYSSISPAPDMNSTSNGYQYNQTSNSFATYGQPNYPVGNISASPVVNQPTSGYVVNEYGQTIPNQYYTQSSLPQDYTQAAITNTSMGTSYLDGTGTSVSTVAHMDIANYYYGDNVHGTSIQQLPQQPHQPPSNPVHPVSSSQTNAVANNQGTTPAPLARKSNIDLLSEFDNISISTPTLLPMKTNKEDTNRKDVSTDSETTVAPPQTVASTDLQIGVSTSNATSQPATPILPLLPAPATTAPNPPPVLPNPTESSIDDSLDAIESDLHTTDDKKSFSLPISKSTNDNNQNVSTNLANIENFIKEVQRFEKSVTNLTTKTLNGTTPLETKWKELHDLLEKGAAKRTVSVSKLFPEKNRNMLHVPYDHARVLLPTETDNYINAAHVRLDEDKHMDLGTQCSHFILADTPTFNTNKDFLCMIWSQNTSCVVCLNTIEEQTQNLFFPRVLNVEQVMGEFSVLVHSERTLSHTTERDARITMCESNETREFSIIHIRSWKARNNISNIVGIGQNVIGIVNNLFAKSIVGPIIFNCATSGERCGLTAITIAALQALNYKQPVIANVTDMWMRICSQRKGALKDMDTFHESMQIVLFCCREYLKMSSVNTPASQTNYYFIEEEKADTKDPFKDLDPLWKLK